jgi:hypothetical protein
MIYYIADATTEVRLDNISCKKKTTNPYPPTTADRLHPNGYDIDITQSIECMALRVDATAGGFNIADGGWDDNTITASTISASDNSISDSGGGFGAVSANQWVLIQGFTDFHNNGFKYCTAATANKLTFGSSSGGASGLGIVDEDAGDSVTVAYGGIVIEAILAATNATAPDSCLTSTGGAGDTIVVIGDFYSTGVQSTVHCLDLNGDSGTAYVIGDVNPVHGGRVPIYTDNPNVTCHVIGDVYSGSYSFRPSILFDSATATNSELYLYGNLINASDGSLVAATAYWMPESSANYIQFRDGLGGTVNAYADTYLPSDDEIKSGVDNGQGGTGTYRGEGSGAAYRGGRFK